MILNCTDKYICLPIYCFIKTKLYVCYICYSDTTGLTTIILKDNQLKPIEGPFLYVNTLLNLDLACCRIRTLSPQFFFNVRNLNTLDLSGNPLDKIQSGIFDPLKSLKHLFLNNCKITYIYFDAFKDLGYLTALDLGENNLKNQVDWTIALNPLGNLQHLDVRKSNISRLDEYSFSNNDLLRSLVLTENELSDDNIDITLGKNIAKLYFLDLSYCNLRGPLFANAFDHATELHTLILSGNKLISEYLAEALFPLVKLVKLSIKDCELIMFPSNSVHNFTNLKELDISKNKLDITYLCLVDSLEHLNMGFNNLERISAKTFSKMSNLKSLVLSGNKLKKLEKGLFKNLKDLEVLELNMCEIRQLNNTIFYKDVPYPNLVELRLSGNPIQIPEEGSIFPFTMSKLNTLDMSKCNLSYLTKEFFTPTPNLKNLLLNNNTLQNDKNNIMKCMERLTCLENLDLAYNNITSITPQEFNYNIQLVSLKLAGNPWKCDYFIVDMLNWALSIKRNTTVLEGIMESNVVNNRLSEILYCNFDPHNSLIERSEPQTSKSKSFTYNYYVTIAWSVYAADSHCTPTETPIRQLRSGRGVTKEVSENQSETLEVDNETEDQLLLIMSVCAVTLVVSVTVAVIFARSREQVIIVNFPRENVEQFL